MKKFSTSVFGILLSLLLFWMIFFTIGRTIFLIYQLPLLKENTFSELLLSYWYGWKMDLSMTAWLLVVPYLFLSILLVIRVKWVPAFLYWYSMILVFLISVIVASELELFVEWGVKLNRKAIFFLRHPTEVFGIASAKVTTITFILIVLQTALAHFLYKKLVKHPVDQHLTTIPVKTIFILLVPCLIILAGRGGIQQVPMNQSVAYYSKSNVLNNAAVNSAWNTTFSLVKGREYNDENPFMYYDMKAADKTVNEIYTFPHDSTTRVLQSSRPNIVMIILEGWSADLIAPLGGYEGVTPEFNALVNEGLLFTNLYASGMRSHEGMAAIFSGFPAQPVAELTSDPSKYPKLPVINRSLEEAGYYNFYGFGGELNYGNIKSYLMYAGFNKVIEGKDFPGDVPRAKLGVHDEYAFPRFLEEIGGLPEPFFASWFTVSSHAPYDIPVPYTLDINGLEKGYLNAVHYSDSCLGVFFKQARNQPWYKNTLFLVMSDHGHSSPKQTPYYDPAYRKIPLLLCGPALQPSFRGTEDKRIGSQTDIAATILAMLDLDHQKFRWSKNLLNPDHPEFAYFAFDDGIGWVEPGNYFSWHHELKKFMKEEFTTPDKREEIIRKGKSHLQVAFQEYLDL